VGYVITSDCTACGACLLTCPEHAIVASLPLLVADDRCTSCGECVEICPADAVLEVSLALIGAGEGAYAGAGAGEGAGEGAGAA